MFLTAYDVFLGYQPPERTDRISPVEALMHTARWTDEWGTTWGHTQGGVGALPFARPLHDWGQLNDYLRSKVPDPLAPGRLDAVRALLEMHGKTKYCVANIHLCFSSGCTCCVACKTPSPISTPTKTKCTACSMP